MGVWAIPMAVIAIAILVLIVRAALQLTRMTAENRIAVAGTIHSVLFWGAVSALLGIIGQNTGLYNALTAISKATQLSPQMIARGIAESLSTTLFGLTTLLVAAIAWFTLFMQYRRASQ
jgi:hypothetical protein